MKDASPPLRETEVAAARVNGDLQGGDASLRQERRPARRPHEERLSGPSASNGSQAVPVPTHLISRRPSSATPRPHLAAGAVGGCLSSPGRVWGCSLPSITGPGARTPCNPHCVWEGTPSESAVGKRSQRVGPEVPWDGGHATGGQGLWEAASREQGWEGKEEVGRLAPSKQNLKPASCHDPRMSLSWLLSCP